MLEKEGEEPLAGRGSDDYGAQDFFNMKRGGETNLLRRNQKMELASAQGSLQLSSFTGPGPVRVGFPAGRNVGLQIGGPQFEVQQFEVPQFEVPEFGLAQVEGGHEGGEGQMGGGGLLTHRGALGGGGPMVAGIVNYAGSNSGDFNVKFLNIELAGYNYGGYARYGHAQFEGVHHGGQLAGEGLLSGRSALGGGGSMVPGIVNSAGSNCGDLNLKFLHIELAGYNYGGYGASFNNGARSGPQEFQNTEGMGLSWRYGQ